MKKKPIKLIKSDDANICVCVCVFIIQVCSNFSVFVGYFFIYQLNRCGKNNIS